MSPKRALLITVAIATAPILIGNDKQQTGPVGKAVPTGNPSAPTTPYKGPLPDPPPPAMVNVTVTVIGPGSVAVNGYVCVKQSTVNGDVRVCNRQEPKGQTFSITPMANKDAKFYAGDKCFAGGMGICEIYAQGDSAYSIEYRLIEKKKPLNWKMKEVGNTVK